MGHDNCHIFPAIRLVSGSRARTGGDWVGRCMMTAKDWEEYRICGHGYRPDAAFECTVTPRDIHKINPSEYGALFKSYEERF